MILLSGVALFWSTVGAIAIAISSSGGEFAGPARETVLTTVGCFTGSIGLLGLAWLIWPQVKRRPIADQSGPLQDRADRNSE